MHAATLTLADLIRARRCRKGAAAGTTKRGAYWLAADPVKIRSSGGDGVGASAPDTDFHLLLRHFRDDQVVPTIRRHSWHQNSGNRCTYQGAGLLGACTSIEEVVVALKSFAMPDGCGDDEPVYSDRYAEELAAALGALGLPQSAPAPDEGVRVSDVIRGWALRSPHDPVIVRNADGFEITARQHAEQDNVSCISLPTEWLNCGTDEDPVLSEKTADDLRTLLAEWMTEAEASIE
jgi:hypothetical protein